MPSLVADLLYSLRSLKAGLTASLFMTLVLSLGIGLVTAIVSTAGATLLAPLPFRNPDQLVAGLEDDVDTIGGRARGSSGATLSQFFVLRAQVPAFASVGVFALDWPQPVAFTPNGSRTVIAASVNASLLRDLGIRPARGRLFDATDDDPDAPPTVIVSHDFWQRELNGDSSAIGHVLMIEDAPTRIVGVLSRTQRIPMASYLLEPDVWRPLGVYRARWKAQPSLSRPDFQVVARLKPGMSIVLAQAQAALASRHTWVEDPTTSGLSLVLTPLHDFVVGDTRTPRRLLLLASVVVICLTIANTLAIVLMGVTAHRQDAAIRHALGGGPMRILAPRIYPVLLLTAGSGAIGLALAAVAVKTLRAITPQEFVAGHVAKVNAVGVHIAILITLGIAGIFTVAIIVRSAVDRIGSTTGVAHAGAHVAVWPKRSTQCLIVIEIALTVVLLGDGSLLLRTLQRLEAVDPGFQSAKVALARVRLTPSRYRGLHARLAVATELQRRLAGLPNANGAAIATATPLDEGLVSFVSSADEGARDTGLATVACVSDSLFRILEIPLLRGRSLDGMASDPALAVVNEVLARRYFGHRNAVGQRLMLGGRPVTIVGVVGSTVTLSLAHERMPQVYLPLQDDSLFQFSIVVRQRGNRSDQIPPFRQVANEVDPHIALDRVTTMAARLAESSAKNRYYTLIIIGAGVIALALSAGGIYGAVLYSTERRTRELAIRIAVGATALDIIKAAVGWIAAPCALGLAIGILGLYWATPLLQSLAAPHPTFDPWAFWEVVVVISSTASVATLIPGRRVWRIDPVRLLGSE